MTFISVIPENKAEGATKELYDGVKARFGFLPNMAKAFVIVQRSGKLGGYCLEASALKWNRGAMNS